MLRRILVDLAIALAYVAIAPALVGGYVALFSIGRLAVRWGWASRPGLVVLTLGFAGVVVLVEAVRLFAVLLRQRKTVRLAHATRSSIPIATHEPLSA
jgi:hypothetical protein